MNLDRSKTRRSSTGTNRANYSRVYRSVTSRDGNSFSVDRPVEGKKRFTVKVAQLDRRSTDEFSFDPGSRPTKRRIGLWVDASFALNMVFSHAKLSNSHMFRRVYLDNSATTQVDERVLAAMRPYMTEIYGNASSIHYFGQQARSAVDKARHQVAQMLNSRPNEVIFTSGGTESNNLAIRGLCLANEQHGKHLIISAIEHPAVDAVCEDLEKDGFETTRLPVYENGIVRLDDLKNAIRADTILVSIMAANNEIGTIQPIEEIGRFVRELRQDGRKIWFHTDAVQAAGKRIVDVESIGCDLLSISGHKIHGPKGVGALYVRRGTRLRSQSIGGRQERAIRAGTESVSNIVALGAATEITMNELPTIETNVRGLRDSLEQQILERIPDAHINGDVDSRLPNITNISFAAVEGEALLINLDMHGIAVSTGSACSSGSIEPSPVIKALGVSDIAARSAIRFSLGRFNTTDDVSRLLDVLPSAVENIRSLSK